MIISGGENIASSEVERVILELPEVRDAAVVGVPDERWGEWPVAFVALEPGKSQFQALTLLSLIAARSSPGSRLQKILDPLREPAAQPFGENTQAAPALPEAPDESPGSGGKVS